MLECIQQLLYVLEIVNDLCCILQDLCLETDKSEWKKKKKKKSCISCILFQLIYPLRAYYILFSM